MVRHFGPDRVADLITGLRSVTVFSFDLYSSSMSPDPSSIMTIGFLYPGNMGASLAHTLHRRLPHLTLLTHLSARSADTTKRSEAAGLKNVPMDELVSRSDVIVSILPPSAAKTLASEVTSIYKTVKRSTPPVFLDANAINPGTVSEIAAILKPSGMPFVDGCVIGGPAREGYDPKIYLSAAQEWEGDMRAAFVALGGEETGKGLKMEMLEGAGEGAASALKMCYGGINKGQTGLAMMMVLGAFRFTGFARAEPAEQQRHRLIRLRQPRR